MARNVAPTRYDLQRLAESRLNEAKVLVQHQLFDGGFYLAGYALELAFKARICKILDTDYPTEGPYSSFRTHSAAFANNWSVLAGTSGTAGNDGWSETWRYRNLGSVSGIDAHRFIAALENPGSGVLTWLKNLW